MKIYVAETAENSKSPALTRPLNIFGIVLEYK